MVYEIDLHVTGITRGSGDVQTHGACAAVLFEKDDATENDAAIKKDEMFYRTRKLPLPATGVMPRPQRAEISAIILGLEWALASIRERRDNPEVSTKIHTDSRHAHECMTQSIHVWAEKRWLNANEKPVVNRDLIEKASDLHKELEGLGTVEYIYVPREDHELPIMYCNRVLDKYPW
ncbi:ribonuclease H-like domain-containing protein [Whalleya microplaca]|nr:ribonuclease H-like domain-containing protein [Whalleya microplaca]